MIIFVATGRTKTAFATKGYKFKFAAMWASEKSPAIIRVTTMDHFGYIFDD